MNGGFNVKPSSAITKMFKISSRLISILFSQRVMGKILLLPCRRMSLSPLHMEYDPLEIIEYVNYFIVLLKFERYNSIIATMISVKVTRVLRFM